MKSSLFLVLLSFLLITVHAQTTKPPSNINSGAPSTTASRPQLLHYDEFWISGSIGAGAVLSTNIINSGAVLPFRTEFLWQRRHHRLGLGLSHELYLTPQSLANLVLNKSIGIHKFYLAYELFLFRNFPVNLGFSSNVGFFTTGDSVRTTTSSQTNTNTSSKSSTGGVFGNVGCVLELGVRPFYIFAKPCIEYQSWSSLHKQIQATASVGVRLKFLSREEKERRAARKAHRHR